MRCFTNLYKFLVHKEDENYQFVTGRLLLRNSFSREGKIFRYTSQKTSYIEFFLKRVTMIWHG